MLTFVPVFPLSNLPGWTMDAPNTDGTCEENVLITFTDYFKKITLFLKKLQHQEKNKHSIYDSKHSRCQPDDW